MTNERVNKAQPVHDCGTGTVPADVAPGLRLECAAMIHINFLAASRIQAAIECLPRTCADDHNDRYLAGKGEIEMSTFTAKDWHGYDVYPDGRVFSNTGWRSKGYFLIKQSLDQYGYPAVRLMIDGKRKRERVHKLVATLFHGPKPSPFHQVCHRDGNKTNNVAGNLYWGDARQNAADRDRHGKTSAGIKHSSSIIAGKANARLIADAPAMLDALADLLAYLEDGIGDHDSEEGKQARALIAKHGGVA